MAKYEAVYIIDPEVNDERVTELSEEVKTLIEKEGGTVDHTEQWGKKKLAYAVKKKRYGYYTLVHYTGSHDALLKLEQFFKYNESVIKYITLTFDPRSAVKPPSQDTGTGFYGHRDRENMR